jgi:2-polyprenyl-6-hydroxyphenyl methylase/3-demethylubiquinone-9 3-methyltransferase
MAPVERTWHKPSVSPATTPASSVDERELAKFSALADEWWDPTGKFAPLHKFNPVRLAFIRSFASGHFGRSSEVVRCFEDISLLDVGCGGGLLCEPMARLGFAVTGIDPSERSIGVARSHARSDSLAIDYVCSSVEETADRGLKFDVVLNMEVVEHVADLRSHLRSCAALVKPGGLIFIATINKTLKSLALAKVAAEYLLGWLPVGTHDWNRFVDPKTLRRTLEESGLNPLMTQGVVFDPPTWDWRLSTDVGVNYMVVAGR